MKLDRLPVTALGTGYNKGKFYPVDSMKFSSPPSGDCVDEDTDCRKDEQSDHSTMVQIAIQEREENEKFLRKGDQTQNINTNLFFTDTARFAELFQQLLSLLGEWIWFSATKAGRRCCLSSDTVQDICSGMEKNLEMKEKDPVVVVHVGNNDI
eukprot:g41063.t1